jgi:hypothetical protein
MEADFRQLFSERFGCDGGDFEARVFKQCLFRHALPFVALLWRSDPEIFREDLDLVRELATARNTAEVVSELNRFYGRNARTRGFLRTTLYLRISGKRVLRLYRNLVREAEEEQPLEEPVAKTA